MEREVSSEYVEITTRPDFLPERQKTTILVGVRIETDSPVRIKLWRSESFLWAMSEEGSLAVMKIFDLTSQHRVEFSFKSSKTLVLASDGIAAERQGDKLGQYIPSGENNKSPYCVQSSNISDSDSRPRYPYRTEDNQ